MQANRFGLTRDIPEPVKRAVRQRDGFGCVICGGMIVDYDHVVPEFKDAQVHDAAGIVLLCVQHHAERTRGFLSKDTVLAAMGAPFAAQRGYSHHGLDIGRNAPVLTIATNRLEGVAFPVTVSGIPVIAIEPPPRTGQPFALSAHLMDKYQGGILIVRNEVRAMTGSWDVRASAGLIEVKSRLRRATVRLRVDPPNDVVIERLVTNLAGFALDGDADKLMVTTPNGARYSLRGCAMSGGRVGIALG